MLRAAQNRRFNAHKDEIGHLLDHVRTWPSQNQRPFDVPASHGRAGRETTLEISFGQASILPPCNEPRGSKDPLTLWVVRVWEADTPEEEEPLEWILLTWVPVNEIEQAWQCVDWYRCRWIVEDDHQCLKTGCRIEERQVQSAERLMRLLGLLSPVAVRLLHLRAFSQQIPERLLLRFLKPKSSLLLRLEADRRPRR